MDGAEHNDLRMDSRTKLKIEISEKKKRRICVFWWKRGECVRLPLLNSGVLSANQ